MDADSIDLADFAEVRRRVVDPVLADLMRPGELAGADLAADYNWPDGSDSRSWMDSAFSVPPGEGPKSLFLILHGGRGGPHPVRLGEVGFFRADATTVAEQITESLFDWIADSISDWGEARTPSAALALAGAVTHVEDRPVVLLDQDGDARPELDVAGAPTAPAALGLSRGLLADLEAWTATLDEDLQAMYGALERLQQARMNAEFGRPAGLRPVFLAARRAAAAQQRAEQALARAHLGRWSLLVAEHEPRRDALIERLRAELGPGFHVPTPARIP